MKKEVYTSLAIVLGTINTAEGTDSPHLKDQSDKCNVTAAASTVESASKSEGFFRTYLQ